jgi:hypothetical protein
MLHDFSIVADCNNGRLNIVAFLLLDIASNKYLSTLFLNSLNPLTILSHSIFSMKWPKKHALLQRIA